MAAPKNRIVRRHKRRTDDGKGFRRMIAGRRFRAPAGIDERECERRFARIEDVWRDNELFCRECRRPADWTPLASWGAEHIRLGEFRVPLPSLGDIVASYANAQLHIRLKLLFARYADQRRVLPDQASGLTWDEAKTVYDVLSEAFPSVGWLLPESHADNIIQFHESAALWSLGQLAKVKNQAPPDPATPLISGNFHAAVDAYEQKRKADFTLPDGKFDGSGFHVLRLIKSFRKGAQDFPLAELDFSRCQALVDHWRDRPISKRTAKPMSKKSSQNHVGELARFFDWLHLTNMFGWRKPEDFSLMNKRVRRLDTDRPSLGDLEIKTFSVAELAILYKYALPFERLLMVWCLNCAHGAAEFGRVEWEDLRLNQEHPWREQGLRLETSDEDNWCGLLRPKTDVIGWWFLWRETAQLIEWWRAGQKRLHGRGPVPNERILVTAEGRPFYRDESQNAQSGFATTWKRLLDRVEKSEGDKAVRRLPFGTLRDQLSDWLGGDENKAVVASIALCHGIPHRGDKLLYRHYSNKPWDALFRAQKDFRQHLQVMFDAVPDPLVEYDPTGDRVRSLWNAGVRDLGKMAAQLNVSEMTVRRRIKGLKLQ